MSQSSTFAIDSRVFDPACIDASTQAANDRLEQILGGLPTILQIPAQAARDARTNGNSFLGPVVLSPNGSEQVIDGPAGPLPLRVFATKGATGVLLHLHGGGWALGAHDQQDFLLDAIAQSTGMAVVSVGYRLTPEHPYPAANDDCEAAALWLVANSQELFGTQRLMIGGESAGAYLAVTTLLRLRDRHGLTPYSAAYLTYGCYDLALTPGARNWGERNLVLSTPIIRQYLEWFAAPDPYSPDVSPLYADLSGLPPALFSVGTLDPLLDDSLFMSSRWSAAGNQAELAIYPGGIHAFNAMPIPLAASANARIQNFLKQCLAD
ncbi:Acetyl esterase [Pseudomonas fluorescens]|uniref:alpha/beta hydrolase n=1 Tax=Pseudomonas fluorescens TaxID=294 RepID=UPI0012416030|nr:alpha/beta hydrolase [Pseudomonas fluorescens]VVO37893.1 Acetyl esterase [Pseudomonas fluorescens]